MFWGCCRRRSKRSCDEGTGGNGLSWLIRSGAYLRLDSGGYGCIRFLRPRSKADDQAAKYTLRTCNRFANSPSYFRHHIVTLVTFTFERSRAITFPSRKIAAVSLGVIAVRAEHGRGIENKQHERKNSYEKKRSA